MTTQSRRVLGRALDAKGRSTRAQTKGASGNASTPERAAAMVKRANEAFNIKLEKMRKAQQEKIAKKEEQSEPVLAQPTQPEEKK